MNAEKLAQVQSYALVIAALFNEEAQASVPEQFKTLEGLEATVREQLHQYVSPEVPPFFTKTAVAPLPGESES